MKKYIILGFDMETDIGSYLKTYNGVSQGTATIVEILKKHSISATFLFTGDSAAAHPEIVKLVLNEGFEVGCHSLKHETVGKANFNMPNDSPILEEEIEYRLKLNKERINKLTHVEPVSFRAPRLWQGQGQIGSLEKIGFKVDLSYSVASYEKQILPYHPSKDDWLEKGDMNLLEIPNFAFLDSRHNYGKYFCKNDQWPLLRLLGSKFMYEHMKYVVEKQAESSDIGILLFYLHPWEFIRMPKKYVYDEGTFHFRPELYKNSGSKMKNEFDKFISLSLTEGYTFTSARDFIEIWENR